MIRLLALCFIPFWSGLTAQDTLPVYEEVHHRLVFETPDLRILDVRLEPGDTSAWHVHRNAITYIGLQAGRIRLEVPGETPRIVWLPDDFWGGDTGYADIPFVHRIANVGLQSFRLLAVEHLHPHRRDEMDSQEGWETLDSHPWAILVHRFLEPGEPAQSFRIRGPALAICRGEGEVRLTRPDGVTCLSRGDWMYLPSLEDEWALVNPGRYPVEVMLLRL